MDATDRRWIAHEGLANDFPARFSGLALPGLWVAGTLEGLAAPCVAVVGTRAPSDAGRRLARLLGEELGGAGVCVVSGLALGIDAAAHEGALAAGGPTIGVLGGGHECFFPPRNRELAGRMVAAGGAVVSPYPPTMPARPYQFLERNGIVAALADAVVVVEAAARSGALNTASWAADRGIPVLAVPGDVDRPKVAGCLALIRDGATLVRSTADVLAELPLPLALPVRTRSRGSHSRDGDSETARAVLAALADGECAIDVLAACSAAPPNLLLSALAELEVTGRIERRTTGYALAD
jgi:DNA processing protein